MLAAWFLVACRTDPAVEAERFFATRPIYERPLDRGTMPAGLTDLSAASCGACHPDAYAEWQVSTHAHAWVDRQFQAEITKSENRWMCQNCHTPLMIQQAQWPVSLVNDDVERPVWVQNPDVSSALQQEGISCASCHVKDGMIVGPNGTQNAAHPTREDASFRGVEVCLRCHQATATYPGKSFVCTFQTGDEWAAGPYGAVNQPCQTCHMPTVVRPIVAGGEPVEAHRHWWAGGGIPKVAGVYPPESALPPGLVWEATVSFR